MTTHLKSYPATRLPVEDVMKVGMWALQCQTTDGRAWQYAAIRFRTDDPRLTILVRKLSEDGATIDPQHWRPIRALGSLKR